jgi:ribosomal protein S18 acetylase RimI-like enzyme
MRHLTSRHDLPSGPLRIRPARPRDAEAVEAIVDAVLVEDRWFLTAPDERVPDPARRHATLKRVGDEANSLALVAVRESRVVGFALARAGRLRRTAHESHVEVYVDAAHRDGGVGRTLISELIRRARERPQMLRLALAVFVDNPRAAAVYRSQGFTEEGHRRGACRERDGTLRDELLMALDVSS